jgi:hypothetical protein
MLENLKKRWQISSNSQLIVVFIVFAITGSTSAWVTRPLFSWLGIHELSVGFWYFPIKLLLIFIIYQFLLVSIGFLFGQFDFFWNFEKKMLRRMGLGFLIAKKKIPK